MDCVLIENWNRRVRDEDDVYIFGDFCFQTNQEPQWYLERLKGHKHLIQGNHILCNFQFHFKIFLLY